MGLGRFVKRTAKYKKKHLLSLEIIIYSWQSVHWIELLRTQRKNYRHRYKL
ncbi:hypothetical protein SPHINGO8BC_51371 [Sphingobacterium multivorum]|uniref:Uncharacterized protein n=1 Tax=Sphingobacterium multivorum TaxID=28454 RepID=A0A654CZP6_SPHMU|nr:hypothetical protein SPHINGO8BC_51371 [Sphingobacterium multivorum]